MEITKERIKNILGIGKNSWYWVFLIISIFFVLFCLNSLFQQRVYDSFTLVLGGYTYFLKFLYTNYKNSNKESFIDNFIF